MPLQFFSKNSYFLPNVNSSHPEFIPELLILEEGEQKIDSSQSSPKNNFSFLLTQGHQEAGNSRDRSLNKLTMDHHRSLQKFD